MNLTDITHDLSLAIERVHTYRPSSLHSRKRSYTILATHASHTLTYDTRINIRTPELVKDCPRCRKLLRQAMVSPWSCHVEVSDG